MAHIHPFRTYRELREAINSLPEELLDKVVYLNMDNGRASDNGGGVLEIIFGTPCLIADGD